MQLKSKDDIQAAVNTARVVPGTPGFATDDAADQVAACCAGVAAMHADFGAIPIATLIALAMQLLPIIFGTDGFSLEKLMAVLQLISNIFVPQP